MIISKMNGITLPGPNWFTIFCDRIEAEPVCCNLTFFRR